MNGERPSPESPFRHRGILLVLLAIAGLGWGSLALGSRLHTEPSVWWLLTVLGLEWAVLLLVMLNKALNGAASLRTIWIAAILFRLIGLLAQPILEDDHYRFLWDGFVFSQTGNPYATAPMDWFGSENVPDSFQLILDRVNYPDVPTIYGPLTELGFLFVFRIDPTALWPWKILLIGADFILLRMVFNLASGEFARQSVLFAAWCPLSIFETSFNAHPEAIAVTLIACAMLARRSGNDIWLGMCCGAAMASRILAAPLVPFLCWGRSWKAWTAAAVTTLAFYLPFWLQGSLADFEGLKIFSLHWEFNSSFYALITWVAHPSLARKLALALFAIIWLIILHRWRRGAVEPSFVPGLAVYASFFLLSPAFNPWYALWLLPFVALRPGATGITLMIVVSLSYLTRQNLGEGGMNGFNHPAWVRPLEFGIVAAVFLWESARRWKTKTEYTTIE